MKKFNAFKRYFGLLFLILAPLVIYELVAGAVANIDSAGKKDINNPVIWIIIITIFTPIAAGLVIFGWYAFRGEYDHLPWKSKELDN
ncbi:MAG: hypothetical protein FJY20_08080 [Bacteroidetes bacterium]|nr:hypothetical protein [Bacteroidota bacterium]